MTCLSEYTQTINRKLQCSVLSICGYTVIKGLLLYSPLIALIFLDAVGGYIIEMDLNTHAPIIRILNA